MLAIPVDLGQHTAYLQHFTNMANSILAVSGERSVSRH